MTLPYGGSKNLHLVQKLFFALNQPEKVEDNSVQNQKGKKWKLGSSAT
jgi:hypothetical protein